MKGRKPLTKEQFIERANKVHNGFYDYSNVIFNRSTDKIKIICPIHGEFKQMLRDHLVGYGCKLCGIEKAKKSRSNNLEEMLEKAKKIHNNKYDYSKVKYQDIYTPVTIVCPIHGEFKQCLNNHINNKHKCPECSKEERARNQIINQEDFINRMNKIHNNKYDYSKAKYKGMHSKINIICPIHGEFKQDANLHASGQGCPRCNESKGEKRIIEWFETNNIRYQRQKRFKECKNRRLLPFDFYLPDYNMCIEYNGLQHYKPVDFYGGEINLNKQKENDKIKQQYCKDNNIKLLIIKYNENVSDVLTQALYR